MASSATRMIWTAVIATGFTVDACCDAGLDRVADPAYHRPAMRPIGFLLPLTLFLPLAAPALAAPPSPASPPAPSRWFYGGGVGLSFGDVDYISISPVIGYRITPAVSAGLGLQYIYRDDNRYAQDYSTSDYGGDLFARYYIAEGFFLSAAYEYLRFQYFDVNGAQLSDDYTSVFAGGGFAQPMSPNASFIVSAMYNVTYDEDEPSPYDSPWVIGAGVSVGF